MPYNGFNDVDGGSLTHVTRSEKWIWTDALDHAATSSQYRNQLSPFMSSSIDFKFCQVLQAQQEQEQVRQQCVIC